MEWNVAAAGSERRHRHQKAAKSKTKLFFCRSRRSRDREADDQQQIFLLGKTFFFRSTKNKPSLEKRVFGLQKIGFFYNKNLKPKKHAHGHGTQLKMIGLQVSYKLLDGRERVSCCCSWNLLDW